MKLSLAKHAAIHNIALTLRYGLEGLESSEGWTPQEVRCALETLAYLGSCRMCRECHIQEGVSPQDITEMLLDYPKADALEKRLVSFSKGEEGTTYRNRRVVWVGGFISQTSGGFEWRSTEAECESVMAQWKADDAADNDPDYCQYEIRPVWLADLGLTGECDVDTITDALDRRSEMWEPNGGAGVTV